MISNVEILAKDGGQWSKTIHLASENLDNPIDIINKFEETGGSAGFSQRRIKGIIDLVDKLDKLENISRLMKLLITPVRYKV